MNGCNGTVAVATTQSSPLATTGDLSTGISTSTKSNIADTTNSETTESSTAYEMSTIIRSYSEQEEFSTGEVNSYFRLAEFISVIIYIYILST